MESLHRAANTYEGLAEGISSRTVDSVNGLSMHILEAGTSNRHLLLVHGFPELSYSWRHVMLPLAQAGFRVIAPDLRGVGYTEGIDLNFDGDWKSGHVLNMVDDMVALLQQLGIASVECVVGHDFGSMVGGFCALIHPTIFRAYICMSAPFMGALLKFAGAQLECLRGCLTGLFGVALGRQAMNLSQLSPPRKHYMMYFSEFGANRELLQCEQGVHAFLRAYFHMKSADWASNEPHEISKDELGKLPHYYIMRTSETMPETVAHHMPSPSEIDTCAWLSEGELAEYAEAYQRTGFQGGLNWYRNITTPAQLAQFQRHARTPMAVPMCFIAGQADWGTYQTPGAIAKMTGQAEQFTGFHLVEGAGHWVQQEKPEETTRLILGFVSEHRPASHDMKP